MWKDNLKYYFDDNFVSENLNFSLHALSQVLGALLYQQNNSAVYRL